jgi:hypothetical protein
MYVITQLHSSVPVVEDYIDNIDYMCTGRREKTQKDDFKRLSFVFSTNVTSDVVQILLLFYYYYMYQCYQKLRYMLYSSHISSAPLSEEGS